MKREVKLSDLDTYVLVDVSNIRAACLLTCNFELDFYGLYDYLQDKYPNLKEVRYYEGLAKGDKDKEKNLQRLQKKGYVIKTLKRRAYTNPPILKSYMCRNCGHRNRVEAMPKTTKLKSNVDVFLATEMLEIAFNSKKPTQIILLSCDGDYAEAIKSAAKNKNINITVIATPFTRNFKNNTLSIRLKNLRKELPGQYHINNIETIKDSISAKAA